jgi:hypothetical protein
MLSSDQQELLTQARQRTEALLQSLQRGRDELRPRAGEWTVDTVEGDAAFAAVIDAARGTLDNLDRALGGLGRTATPTPREGGNPDVV